MTSDAVSPRIVSVIRRRAPAIARAGRRGGDGGRSPRSRAGVDLELTGPNGLKLFTKNVLETALNEELTEHLGHPKNRTDPGCESTNVRNGFRSKTVISDAVGEMAIDV